MQNKDDLSDIAERCQRVAVIIKKAMESGSLPKDGELEKAIDKLKMCVLSSLINPTLLLTYYA